MSLVLMAVVFCTGVTASTGKQDAILTIWAESSTGSGWIGTGFLIKADGQFLTCYHVIRGAKKLTVYRGKEAYGNLEVLAIAPSRDLAVMKIMDSPFPLPFLELAKEDPSRFFDEELTVFGSPNGLPGQELRARATAPQYVLSGLLRSPDDVGNRIFEIPDVKLISLQMTVFNGLSGGPVISTRGVVGILSGSYTQGGTIAWAVPSIYATPTEMTAINRPFGEISIWPDLSLMRSSGWNTLRYRLSVSAGLSFALDSYLSALEELSMRTERLVESARQVNESIDELLVKADALHKAANENAKISPEMKEDYLAAKNALSTSLHQFAQSHLGAAADVMVPRFERLLGEVQSSQNALPRTKRNKARFSRANADAQKIKSMLIRHSKSLTESTEAFGNRYDQLMARLGQSSEYSNVRQFLTGTRDMISDFFLGDAERQLKRLLNEYRGIGNIANSVLTSEEPGELAR